MVQDMLKKMDSLKLTWLKNTHDSLTRRSLKDQVEPVIHRSSMALGSWSRRTIRDTAQVLVNTHKPKDPGATNHCISPWSRTLPSDPPQHSTAAPMHFHSSVWGRERGQGQSPEPAARARTDTRDARACTDESGGTKAFPSKEAKE